jgi:ankyrin repeat protein
MPKSESPRKARKSSEAPRKQTRSEAFAKPRAMNLTLAATRSDMNSAVSLLARGADPDRTFPPYLDAPLWIACKKKNAKMAKLLLGAGANPNKKSFQGEPPLALAADLGHLELAITLCAAGANPDIARDSDGKRPIDIARERSDIRMEELLSAARAYAARPDNALNPKAHNIVESPGVGSEDSSNPASPL